MSQVEAFRPHLMVLDVMLPDIDGLRRGRAPRRAAQHACRSSSSPRATRPEDKLRGLTTGGDDYVTKPFSLEELVARIRAILRRTGQRSEPSPTALVFEDLELDEDTHEVTRAGEQIELTATEFRLLRYLLSNPRRVLTRAQILDHVWEYDFGGDARVLETYVSYLRKKLDAHGPPLIHTVARRRLRPARAAADASLRARLVLTLSRSPPAGCSCSARSPTPRSAPS